MAIIILFMIKMIEYIQQTNFRESVYIPKVYWNYSSKRVCTLNETLTVKVLTCEWIDGVKFTTKETLESQGFNVYTLMTTMVNIFADVPLTLTLKSQTSKSLGLVSYIVIPILETSSFDTITESNKLCY